MCLIPRFYGTVAITDAATSGVDETEPDLEGTDSFRQTTQEPSPSKCSASGESGDGQTRQDKITPRKRGS